MRAMRAGVAAAQRAGNIASSPATARWRTFTGHGFLAPYGAMHVPPSGGGRSMSQRPMLCGLAAALFWASADVPLIAPISVAPVTVSIPAGPIRAIVLESTAELYPGGGVGWYGSGAIDVRLPSGFGIRLDGDLTTIRSGPGNGMIAGGVGSRLYRAFGDFTIGAVSSVRFTQFYQPGPPWSLITNLGIGLDADYHTDAIEAALLVGALFDNAGAAQIDLEELRAVVDATIHPGPRSEVKTVAALQYAPGFNLLYQGYTELRYAVGPVTPFVRVSGSLSPGLSLSTSVGAEFDYRVRGGPLTLTGRTEFYFGWLTYYGFQSNMGFEYALGDGPLTLQGEFLFAGHGDWRLSVGIGAKLGTGTLSGFLDPDFRL